MRAFLLPSRGDANAPTRSVDQPAASQVPSSLEQPADPFTSINALTVWLKAQGVGVIGHLILSLFTLVRMRCFCVRLEAVVPDMILRRASDFVWPPSLLGGWGG